MMKGYAETGDLRVDDSCVLTCLRKKEDIRDRKKPLIPLAALLVPYDLHPCYNQRKRQKIPSQCGATVLSHL